MIDFASCPCLVLKTYQHKGDSDDIVYVVLKKNLKKMIFYSTYFGYFRECFFYHDSEMQEMGYRIVTIDNE